MSMMWATARNSWTALGFVQEVQGHMPERPRIGPALGVRHHPADRDCRQQPESGPQPPVGPADRGRPVECLPRDLDDNGGQLRQTRVREPGADLLADLFDRLQQLVLAQL
jgi:hypothetical protein